MKKSYSCLLYFCLLIGLLLSRPSAAQTLSNDSAEYKYPALMANALNADIDSVLKILRVPAALPFTQKSRRIRKRFEERFLFESDSSNYLAARPSSLDGLLTIYVQYWRTALLHPAEDFDTLLGKNLSRFLSAAFAAKVPANNDSLDLYLKKYITRAGYHTTGYGKTGKLLDLLIWKDQCDTLYRFTIKNKTVHSKVVFMDNFLTLGWEEYATLEINCPGGWATSDALYCVKKAYDLKSEKFTVSYLAHEGNHLSDYAAFPKLKDTDLEYRAKLIELSLARTTLPEIINFFIQNANAKSSNAHSLADYFVIKNLSWLLFRVPFEKNIESWKKVSPEKINHAAAALYLQNTKDLKKAGAATVTEFVAVRS